MRRRAALIREAIGPERHADDGRQPVLGRRRRDRRDGDGSASSTRGGSRSQRARTTSSDTRGSAARSRPIRVATGEHVQNRVIFKQLFQARGDRRLPDRCLPSRRRQRGAGGHPAGGQVRGPGLSACRRRGPVRVRPAPRDVRLHRRQREPSRIASSNGSTTSTSISVTRPLWSNGRYMAADGARIQHRDAPGIARRVRVPARRRAWTDPTRRRARRRSRSGERAQGRQSHPRVGCGTHAAAVDDRGARRDRAPVRAADIAPLARTQRHRLRDPRPGRLSRLPTPTISSRPRGETGSGR